MSLFPSSLPVVGLAVGLTAAAAALSSSDERTLADVEKELQLQPNDPELLLEAADTAFADADDDMALWYAELARLWTTDKRAMKKVNAKLESLRGEIGVELAPIGGATDEYVKDVFQFAKLCGPAKFYANAADVLGSLTRSRYGSDAQSRLDKLFKSKKAVGAMLESGVPVKVEVKQKRSAKEIARLDEKHSEWDEAYEAKGKYYTIKTNMGVEMAEAILGAMEQMNGFYRKVFDYKAQGGSMRRCEVRVWKTRDGFDAFNPDTGDTVAGFYSPMENSVSTYDPRTASGFMQGPVEELWSTLYHEASHQFTRMKWKLLIPTWLNEGTASYFEGAALLPGGYVETNRIPDGRLRSVVAQIGGIPEKGSDELPEPRSGAPKLKDVISYFAPGSYPGAYYSFGWALVYFCMNYENEDSERVYLPIYRAFMDSYTGSGEEKNPFDRFERYFVTDAELPGVESYKDFERRWKLWVFDLARIEYGGPEQADVLIERAKKQIENGKVEYAIDSLRWALRKRVDDPLALRMLAECYVEVDNEDAALFAYRRLVRVGRGESDPETKLDHYDGTAGEAIAAGLAGIKEVNESLGRILEEAYEGFVDGAIAEADTWAEAGYPRVALQSLHLAEEVVGGEGRLLARANEIRDESGVDIRRTRRLTTTESLENWELSGEGWSAIEEEDGTTGLRNAGLGIVTEATFSIEPPEVFLYEVDVVVEEIDDTPVVGLTFAGDISGNTLYVRIGKKGSTGIVEWDPDTGQPDFKASFKAKSRLKAGEPFTLGIEVGRKETRFLVDGEEVGTIEQAAAAASGRLGVMAQRTKSRFLNPRVTY
ncbi:MAG: hypothetical protein AAGA20_09350 [Planctomycetota bacterium]